MSARDELSKIPAVKFQEVMESNETDTNSPADQEQFMNYLRDEHPNIFEFIANYPFDESYTFMDRMHFMLGAAYASVAICRSLEISELPSQE